MSSTQSSNSTSPANPTANPNAEGSLSSHLWDSSDLYRNAVMQLEEAARGR